jgi:hypothetical protein
VADLWLPSILLVSTALLAGFILVRSGALLTPEAASIRQVRRRLLPREGRWSTAIARSSIGHSLQERFAIRRLQLVAGRGEPQAFVRRLVTVTVVTILGGALLDAATALSSGSAAVAPAWIVVAAALAALLTFVQLQRDARRRQDTASLQVAKTLLLFGMLRVPPVHSPEGLQPADPLMALARAMRDRTLAEMLASDGWRQFTTIQPRSRAELLEALGDAYGVAVLAQLAQVVRSAQEYGGSDPATEYLAAARSFTAQRLADARVRLGSRTITVLVPMVGLLAAIFVVIFSAVAYASANGGL